MKAERFNAMGAASFFIHDCKALEGPAILPEGGCCPMERFDATYTMVRGMVYHEETPVGYFKDGEFHVLNRGYWICRAIETLIAFYEP
jgi:hypothetical protein